MFTTLSEGTEVLLRTGTAVQKKAEAGHNCDALGTGPVFSLMGIVTPAFDSIYNTKESLSAFKPRFAELVVSGAVFPETTVKVERVEFGKVVQAAVDACQVKAAATIDEQLANLAKFAKIANDTDNKDEKSEFWMRKMKDCGVPVANSKSFKAVGGNKAPEGWAKAARRYATTRKAELETKKSSGDDEKAAHRAAAYQIFSDVHRAVEKYEKPQLEKAVSAGGNALHERLMARAEARSEYMRRGGARDTRKAVAAMIRARRKNRWTRTWSTARRNNDPFSRRVRVLTNRMRSTGPLIRDFEDREEKELFDRE